MTRVMRLEAGRNRMLSGSSHMLAGGPACDERASYAHVPYNSLESIIETSKEGYYRTLRRTRTTLQTKKPD